MEVLSLNKQGITACVKNSIKILRAGGIILYPTDTVYGLGADAFSNKAVGKIYKLKGRDEKKPIHAIVADIKMIEKYAEVSDFARMLAKEFLPGPLTLILKKKAAVKTGIGKGIRKIGFRIPNHKFCIALVKKIGTPITTTSANKSGNKTERTIKAILKQLGVNNSYASVLPARRSLGAGGQKTAMREKSNIDLVIDAGNPPDGGEERLPSTIVDLTGNEPVILREGVISASEIWNLLGTEFQD
ncbi:threonylcarbamoyl-AMP synthase [Candidatus Kaiserbacteria bacterium RIFCSPHIGHO2_02_FULL_49_16]|uniref:L-threonylcarbamoyladenylate synthase n=1 Tax=Candidatus Kaiserbacteria bacterium RIFCSPHIGHO2_02_FULL_49_16 TaxID=1798490 RepID=A0A1F6DA16_9BACT|nr:MAG: threonylcarbamoyl-AMP synthase [Candidatus Kaiserbacteria bacterium RIFCSPHIGHO2_02_FULL_49_16]